MSHPLNSAAEQFQKTGYVVVKNAFAREAVEPLLRFIEERRPHVAPRFDRTRFGEYPAENAFIQLLMPIVVALKNTGILHALLGHETLYLRMPPSVRYITPDSGSDALAPPHQDGVVLPDMPDFVTAWFPLVEVDDTCRGLAVYPGLGHAGPHPYTVNAESQHQRIDVGTVKPVAFKMVPGDVLIFHKFMAHGALPNTSDRTRISVDMRFFATTEKLPRFYCDLQTGELKSREQG